MAWCFEDQANAHTESILERVGKKSAVVPVHWPLEVANVLLVTERRGKLTEAQSFHFVHLLGSLPIMIDANTAAKALADSLILGRQHRLSSYDSAYLELALREGLPFATQDDALRRAATATGVKLI